MCVNQKPGLCRAFLRVLRVSACPELVEGREAAFHGLMPVGWQTHIFPGFLSVLPPSLPPSLKLWWTGKLWWTYCLPAIAHTCERRLVNSVVKITFWRQLAGIYGSRVSLSFARDDVAVNQLFSAYSAFLPVLSLSKGERPLFMLLCRSATVLAASYQLLFSKRCLDSIIDGLNQDHLQPLYLGQFVGTGSGYDGPGQAQPYCLTQPALETQNWPHFT